MPACPTGALAIVEREQIDMGTANWFEQTCRITQGEDCTICLDDCPIGRTAIELQDGRIHVFEEGCTGCGLCQNHGPTDPKSSIAHSQVFPGNSITSGDGLNSFERLPARWKRHRPL